MPKVSILIPAYRPDFLDACIASALAQSYRDFELLISDDSGGDVIAAVVSKWEDPRIKYVKNPDLQVSGANRDHLLSLATGKYAKFLFDDDMLMPGSVELLVAAIEQYKAKIAFHNRYITDRYGAVHHMPEIVPKGQVVMMPPDFYMKEAIGKANNFVGEPTVLLIDLEALRQIENPFGVAGIRMRYLTDVAVFANFISRQHVAVGVGYMGAAFRRHEGQNSNINHPLAPIALLEWELLMRWSMQHGQISPKSYQAGIKLVYDAYRARLEMFPIYKLFLQLKGPAGKPEAAGRYLGHKYMEALAEAYKEQDARQLAFNNTRKNAAN